ncbi:MAG: ABC transporter permease [Phycisphaerae bacterium]|nr:ABC transporter permease [Phycisphaerae bacterium]
MRRWWQVAIRNWLAKPARTLLATGAIALGVAVVVWVTSCYESVRHSIVETVAEWIGRAQISVESVAGRWAVFDASVGDGLDRIPGVVRTTRRTLETVYAVKRPADLRDPNDPDEPGAIGLRLDLVGIELPTELEFRTYRIVAGRMLRPDESHGILIEELLAREWDLSVGQSIIIKHPAASGRSEEFQIVGLIDRRRVSSHQLPMGWTTIPAVQRLFDARGKIKGIDIRVADDRDGPLRETAAAIRRQVRERDRTLKVSTTEAQLRQLRTAQSQLQFVLMLISCVALLTAFFIILSTMSMSVLERITELGLLRCVGMTRAQVLALVLVEVLPISAAAVLLGIPVGIGLQWLTIQLVPEYIGRMMLSTGGVTLAVAGGIGTALLGALGPAVRAALVSPIAATRTAASGERRTIELGAALLGALLLVGHQTVLSSITSDTPHFAILALGALLLLYGGYALIAPLAVVAYGAVAEAVAAAVLRVRRRLISDQVGRRPWRSGAVCSGLMVGLSLIVGLQVHSESVKAGWQFPKQFPEAMIYSWEDVPLERMQAAARASGVADATIADDVRCRLIRKGRGFLSVLDPFYRFIAGDPDTFPKLIKLVYLEGNEADALERLRRGGAILVTREFSLARNIHLDDEVALEIGDTQAKFRVAGVIASPAIDIAVSFFNASGEFQVYAVGSFIGTLADAERLFGRRKGRLLLFNFDRAVAQDAPEPPGFEGLSHKPVRDEQGRVIPQAEGHLKTAARVSGSEREKDVVQAMMDTLGSPQCAFVTARQLKDSIDRNIDRVTLLLAAIPAVGLIVAALGVANLMIANVAARMRPIAVLRAVGTTRFQIIRLVAAEALILGVLGSALGLALGLHLGRSSNRLTHVLWGFEPQYAVPWAMVSVGMGLALSLCLLAGIGPARLASRSNIVAALQRP